MRKKVNVLHGTPEAILEYIFKKMDLKTLKSMIEKLTLLHESKCLDEIQTKGTK